jgi:hypothetical protein
MSLKVVRGRKMVSQKSKGHVVASYNKPLTHESLGGGGYTRREGDEHEENKSKGSIPHQT